ncbi:MAG: TraR/DksA family transcriptional regulator [Planctomycetes bacterium]|nr:TraR/DksA family transcriptional regulator [Planctomycetota bacterium]
MRARERDRFKKLLLERRAKLSGTLISMADEALKPHGGGHDADEIADMGSDQFEQELTLGLMESERQEVNLIDEALDRIEDGSFGECLGCEATIPTPRLMAIPSARYCIACQSYIERHGSLPGDHDED